MIRVCVDCGTDESFFCEHPEIQASKKIKEAEEKRGHKHRCARCGLMNIAVGMSRRPSVAKK